jgi:hypothetical protein
MRNNGLRDQIDKWAEDEFFAENRKEIIRTLRLLSTVAEAAKEFYKHAEYHPTMPSDVDEKLQKALARLEEEK